ncbi:MAG: hypothetical protein OXG08_00235 [Gammaproteobacteria bacterium]|nr:hypothetical protein [Gammaproteobacteria bacterium]
MRSERDLRPFVFCAIEFNVSDYRIVEEIGLRPWQQEGEKKNNRVDAKQGGDSRFFGPRTKLISTLILVRTHGRDQDEGVDQIHLNFGSVGFYRLPGNASSGL